MGQIIECSFSLLDTERKYTGTHRKYVISNARDICYAPKTREMIEKREALGFYGHMGRVLCGRPSLQVQELDVITLPNGTQAMVSQIPSNVTIAFDVDADGTVKHKQEILDTETGKIVAGLHASRVGGFSWACPGTDGGKNKLTTLTGFAGFDYVLTPGFSANRGYVLESAQTDIVLESVAAIVGNDKTAEQIIAGWSYEPPEIIKLRDDAIHASREKCFELQEANVGLRERLSSLENQLAESREAMEQAKTGLAGIMESLPIFIPEPIMQEMLAGDFGRAKGIFESAARVDFTQLPLKKHTGGELETIPKLREKDLPEYGSPTYGFDLVL